MSKLNIIFVSHCVFNTASKVSHKNKEINSEEIARKSFLKDSLEKNIQIIQLPCPELMMYGTKRWGHSKDQFNNPFFREKCKEMLNPYLLQMQSYLFESDKFNILGIVGIEGSPSCGVNMSFCGDWGGEFSSCDNLDEVINGGELRNEKGIFMEVLSEMMKSNNIHLPILGLKANVLNEFLK